MQEKRSWKTARSQAAPEELMQSSPQNVVKSRTAVVAPAGNSARVRQREAVPRLTQMTRVGTGSVFISGKKIPQVTKPIS